jgi:DNA-binding MltR family transcriptional regulator
MKVAEDVSKKGYKDKKVNVGEDLGQFLKEFEGESDRAVVILGSAKLDLLLYQLLVKYLLSNPSSQDSLFDGDAPLSSFSAKINLTLRLGLIDSNVARALHQIRKIRNAFAHEVTGCKLDSGIHRDRVKELVAPLKRFEQFDDLRETLGLSEGPPSDFRTMLTIMVGIFEWGFVKVKPLSKAKDQISFGMSLTTNQEEGSE